MNGRKEEEIEGEHAGDRDRNGVGEAPPNCDRKNRKDIENAEAENWREGLQTENGARDCGDGKRAEQDAGDHPAKGGRGLEPHASRIGPRSAMSRRSRESGCRPRPDVLPRPPLLDQAWIVGLLLSKPY